MRQTFIYFYFFSPVFLSDRCDANPSSELVSPPSFGKKKKTQRRRRRFCPSGPPGCALPRLTVRRCRCRRHPLPLRRTSTRVPLFFSLFSVFFFFFPFTTAMDLASLSALHCHAVRMARARAEKKKNGTLPSPARLWRAQRFAPQSALPYLPRKHREVGEEGVEVRGGGGGASMNVDYFFYFFFGVRLWRYLSFETLATAVFLPHQANARALSHVR